MKLEIDLEQARQGATWRGCRGRQPPLLVDELATLVAKRLEERFGSPERSPWMGMADAIAYTGVPAGTFRKWVAEGRIPSHGGRRRLFHRAELDAALGYVPPETRPAPIPLRRA